MRAGFRWRLVRERARCPPLLRLWPRRWVRRCWFVRAGVFRRRFLRLRAGKCRCRAVWLQGHRPRLVQSRGAFAPLSAGAMPACFASAAKWALTCAIAVSEMAQPSFAAFACVPSANALPLAARSRRRANSMRSPCGSSTLSMPSFSKRPAPSKPCLPPGWPSGRGTHCPGATTPATHVPAACRLAHRLSSHLVLPICTSPVSRNSTLTPSFVLVMRYIIGKRQ